MKLVVTKSNQVIQTLELDTDIDFLQEFLVGRASHCHICIQDSNLSREHGTFTLENKQLFYIESGQQQKIKLKNLQVIMAGDTKIQFIDDQADKNNSNIIETKIQKQSPQKDIEEIKITPNTDYNDLNEFEAEDHKLSATMLEETMRLGEDNAVDQENAKSINQEENFSNDFAENLFQVESIAAAEPNNTDNDSTRVISDFVNYQLVLSGPNIPFERFTVSKPVTLIGRNNQCDIVLNDTEVSSQHAHFVLKNNNLFIEDLKSVNGIFVNGQKINKQQLVEDDIVTISNVTFLVKVKSDFIEGEKNSLMPTNERLDSDSTQEFSLNDFAQVDSSGQSPSSSMNQKRNAFQDILDKLPFNELKNNPKRLVMYGFMSIALLAILFFNPDDDQNTSVVVKTEEKKSNDINSSQGDSEEDTEVNSTAKTDEPQPKDERNQEEINYLNSHYSLAMSYIERGDYVSAISEIDLVLKVDPSYKDISSLHGIAKDGLAKIEEQERKRKDEEERLARKKEVDEYIVKIEDSLKNNNLSSAEVYISQVMSIDPENLRVSSLKLEIDAIREDIRKRAEQEALKNELRNKMVSALTPGKSFFLQKEWYKSIIKLSDFLSTTGLDEDLIVEASTMLKEAKNNLSSEIAQPLENARHYKNAQDLKNAYEQYSEVLHYDPSHEESLISSREIKEVLMNRARIVYRQALVSESISHFRKAKEKFQEVLLIAPSDSEYYKKAEDKLKKIYLE